MSESQEKIKSYSSFIKDHPEIKIIPGLEAGKHIKVYLDDLIIEGDLSLDTYSNFDAIYCLGDLNVKGDIENYNSDGGIGLFVAGETKAVNIIAGGAVIYFNQVSTQDLCVAHYNDGILDINEFIQGVLISNDHSTGFEKLGKQAVAFLDYSEESKNAYFMQEFHDLFADEAWIEVEDDDEEIYTYFMVDDFIGLLADKKLDNKNIKKTIDQYQKKVEQQEREYKSISSTALIKIKNIISHKVGDMRSSGYDFDELLYDLEINKNDRVKIFHENTHIEGDFCIDQDQWEGYSLLLIDGDLKVNGTIYNHHKRPAINTLVIGNVQCKNFLFSHNHFYITGSLNAQECFYGYAEESAEESPELVVSSGITSEFPIIEYGLELDARFKSETKLIFANSNIRGRSRPINEIKTVIEPEFIGFDNDDHVLINSEKLLDALLTNTPFYNKEKVIALIEKSEKRKLLKEQKSKKWEVAFKEISDFLKKYAIQSYGSSFLSIESDGFVNVEKETEDAKGLFDLGFELKKNNLVLRINGNDTKVLKPEGNEEIFLKIIEKYLSDQLTEKSYYLGMFIQIMDSEGQYLVDCFDGLNNDEINNIMSSPDKSVITTQFNLDKQELKQLFSELKRTLA